MKRTIPHRALVLSAAILVALAGGCGSLVLRSGAVAAASHHLVRGTETRQAESGQQSASAASWSIVPSPNAPGAAINGLWGVAAVATSDVWAVGHAIDQSTNAGQTLTEHWNGTAWQVVPSPSPSAEDNILFGVSAVSASDLWAVGYMVSAPGVTQTLIEHWDGSTWQVVTSPNPGTQNNELFGVSVVSANDVWAAGFTSNSTTGKRMPVDKTLVEHWNGTQWNVIRSPNPYSGSNHLEAVAAVSASDVWATGTGISAGHTLIEHWNGKAWSAVTSPSPGSGGDLDALAVVSPSDVWAVGSYTTTTGATLTEQWNGTQWRVIASPNTQSSSLLSGVAAVSASDLWAVGSAFDATTGQFQTVTERGGGTRWSIVASPSPSGTTAQLISVAALGPTDVWAVGHATGNTLIEHYSAH